MKTKNVFDVWDKIEELFGLEALNQGKGVVLFKFNKKILKLKQIIKEATDSAYKEGFEHGKKEINYNVSEWRAIGKRLKFWNYFEGVIKDEIIKKIKNMPTLVEQGKNVDGYPVGTAYIKKHDIIKLIKSEN